MAWQLSSLAFLSLLFALVSSELVLEDGYTVTTVFDGNKLNINPYSVISLPGSSDLIVLDSLHSVFYTLSFPLSQESVIKRLAGGEEEGYSDGEMGSARIKEPKSFTVDMKGNVYVADRSSRVIRKINNSGVTTTIAGRYAQKQGKVDGPGQNASFSSDFGVTFVPQICALLISDHGNRLIRQINLKAEVCARSSHSALGAVSGWVLGLVLTSLVSFVIGVVVRPCIIPCTEQAQPPLFQPDMEAPPNSSGQTSADSLLGIISVTASSTLYTLLKRLFWLSRSHLTLMFRINNIESRCPQKDFVSLLDSNDVRGCGCEINKSPVFAEQPKDLISFDENENLLIENTINHRSDGLCDSHGKLDHQNLLIENTINHRSDGLSDSHGKLDDMIEANIIGFAGEATETTPEVGTFLGSSGLVRRR